MSLEPEHRVCTSFAIVGSSEATAPSLEADTDKAPICADPRFQNDPRCAPWTPAHSPGATTGLGAASAKLLPSHLRIRWSQGAARPIRFSEPIRLLTLWQARPPVPPPRA